MMRKIAVLVFAGLAATSLAGCGGGCERDVAFTWSLVDAANNPISCQDVGATQVTITMGSMTATFDCRLYQGMTAPLPAGTYSTSFDLLDANGTVLSHVTPQDVDIRMCGTADLGSVQFST